MKTNKPKDKIINYILKTAVLLLALTFVVKFGGANILKLYIETGLGNSQKAPLLYMLAEQELIKPSIDEAYLAGLKQYNFPEIQIRIPKEFTVVNEKIKIISYKNKKDKTRGDIAYLLYEKPDFFIELFPQVNKLGISNNYDFLCRTMYARTSHIQNIPDAFFVIMKGVFTPDVGEQKSARILKFTLIDKKGFITYNLSKKGNFFDCNIVNSKGDFFKVYIKDISRRLNLSNVIAIVSSVKKD